MLERLIAWVLNSYIGEYFGNVNTDQLSVALHQGEVELEGLPLKVESLRHWGLPVDVKAGYIGKVRLKIPVYRIRTEPWSISVEELYIVAHSLTDFTYNEAVEKQSMQDYKLSLLDALEMRWKSQHESNEEQSYYASSYTSWLSFGASLVSNIIENVQLNIKSVHIRYEDTTSIKGCQIACGIVVRNLYAQSADKDFDSKFATNDAFDCMKKAVTLEGFDLYWDTNSTLIGDYELTELVESMRTFMDTSSNADGPCDHNYILSSVCGKAQLVRNLSERPLRSRSKPRLRFDLILERFPLTLHVMQYRQMLEWADEFSRTSTVWQYRKWRPVVPLHESRVAWWWYAANVHLNQWRTRMESRKWSFVMKRVKDILKYKEVYYSHLTKPETLMKELKEEKDRIEAEWNFDEICIVREIVFKLVKASIKKTGTEESSSTLSWPNWILGWYSQQPAEETTDETNDSESIFKRESFEDRFIFDNIENETFLRRDTVFSHINLIVEQASFTLVSDLALSSRKLGLMSPTGETPNVHLTPILELEFTFMTLLLEWRPRVRSYKFDIKLKGLNVKDKMSKKPVFEYLVSPQKNLSSTDDSRLKKNVSLLLGAQKVAINRTMSDGESEMSYDDKEEYLFEFLFEKKPLSAAFATEVFCCKKVYIRSRPLEIIYNQKAFEAFINFFTTKKIKTGQRSKITAAAKTHYEELKKQTKANIQSAVDDLFEGGIMKEPQTEKSSNLSGNLSAVKWCINLDISAPQIIIPENLLDLNSTLIIFDLGRLQFKNTNNEEKNTIKQVEVREEYKTPSESPEDSDDESNDLSNMQLQQIMSGSVYEQYILDLSDIQVLVGKAGHNWQFGLGRGSGPMHILNRFSISLQMERKVSQYSYDSTLPRVLLKGSLPKLSASLNEHKMKALLKCLQNIAEKTQEYYGVSKPVNRTDIDDSTLDDIEASNVSSVLSQDSEAVLFVCQFCIEEVSVAIQSQGENLVEFQVSGVEAKYQRRSGRSVISLCVHGLLLIDAHQKYGNEFDVLMASHRDVRIVDSSEKLDSNSFVANYMKRRINNSNKNDYLISAEYVVNEHDHKKSISVLFNNLDVVANQETIIELVKFFEQINVFSSTRRLDSGLHPHITSLPASKSHNYYTDFRFDFKRLNILLLRASYIADENHPIDRKLATATMSGTTISARIESSNIYVEGSLNALHVIDLVDDISLQKHQRVLSVATDVVNEEFDDDSLRQPFSKLWGHNNEKALKFVVTRNNRDDSLTINSSLSSLCYDHSTKLFRELTLCASEFKHYISTIVNIIKDKAAEVTLDIVTKAKQDLGEAFEQKRLNIQLNSKEEKKQSSIRELVIVLELSKINMRFSYNDFALIAHILKSLPKDTQIHLKSPQGAEKEDDEEELVFALPSHLRTLQSLGFAKEDCVESLQVCQGNLNDAALWLTQNAKYLHLKNEDVNDFFETMKLYTVMSLHIQNGTLCLIDDCKDTDVPLFELGFTDLELSQKVNDVRFVGRAKSVITCDYFNRSLSGWEPLLEPWKSDLNWEYELRKSMPSKFVFGFDSEEPLNIVITSSLLDLYRTVRQNWMEDYNQLNQSNVPPVRQHSPFVPFAIKNETGCKLHFYTVTSSVNDCTFATRTPPVSEVSKLISYITGDPNQRLIQQQNTSIMQPKHNWIAVEPDEIVPFSFEDQALVRHQNSHVLKSHKIVVHVDGWHQVFPVSVDKVGIYFREAKPEMLQNENARIVFEITLESNARKMITVRSALLFYNGTPNAIEVQFEAKGSTPLYLVPEMTMPVPIPLVRSKMWIRPYEVGVSKCKEPLRWEHVRRLTESSGEIMVCSPLSLTGKHSSYSNSLPYYISVLVNRLNFPPDNAFQNTPSFRALPAHRISLLPPLQVTNLLPYELRFTLQGCNSSHNIKPGKKYCLQYVNTTKEFSLYFSLDNFPKSKPLTIIPGATKDAMTSLEMYDRKDRLLILKAHISATGNDSHAISVVIFSGYWLINRTGLPLVFKQEGVEHEAAGQFEEHEVARSIVPFLFNFLEVDGSSTCKVRLGKSLGRSCWTNSFYLHKGTRVRRLRIASNDPRRPDNVYEIGIDVKNGRGRYRGTLIVTFSPRYQIENTTSLKLEILQKFIAYSNENINGSLICVLPNSNVAFQWSRSDQDKLLCVRIASLRNCHWSGGFAIEPNSFHLNIRDDSGKSHFIRVEILLEGATFFIVFSDAANLPPPIRVDNFSDVPIEFYQTNVAHTWMKTTVRPRSSIPYAWDESTLKPYITACAPGGCSATYNMNSLRPGDNLTYENFFYIAFTGTFLAIDDEINVLPLKSGDITSLQLVLDVPEGSNNVILSVKEPGKRSQLWRIGSDGGRIHHEGSSPPRDPIKSNLRSDRKDLVLDIKNPCVMPGVEMPLVISGIDSQRNHSQLWSFTSSGRLVCEHSNLCVQPKGGFLGLKVGNIAVLGSISSTSYKFISNGTPFEQAISIQKMRKGSGMLALQVLNDGPTRVLQIVDVRNAQTNGIKSLDKPKPTVHGDPKSSYHGWLSFEFKLNINAAVVSLSLVNKYNEELLYASLSGVIFEYHYKLIEHFLNCSVRYFQVDNQLRNAEKPVVLYRTEGDPKDPVSYMPVVSLSAHKLILPQVEINFFETVQLRIRDITLNVEELLLLKLFQFVGFPQIDSELHAIDDNEEMNTHKAITSALSKSPRLYFTTLEIELNCVKLSVSTTSHLPVELSIIKKKAGLRLIRFEDVFVRLMPFQKNFSLETFHFLVNAIFQHYRSQLFNQSAKILGAVDFLGNPLGFVNDVADGLNDFFTEGSVHGLITNIAHGISDSTAKFTSALSDSLGVVAMDARHDEIRKRIKQENNDYIRAGIKGLGVGLFGGVMSIITQTYNETSAYGAPGLLSGFGKGVIGTFTKPAIGMLDFATGAASVVRESSRKTSNASPTIDKARVTRQCSAVPGLLLPRFDVHQAMAQLFFYRYINDKKDDEHFISFQMILPEAAVMITSEKVRFISWSDKFSQKGKVQIAIEFQNLTQCQSFTEMNVPGSGVFRYYVIVTVDRQSSISSHGKYDAFGEFKNGRLRIRASSRQTAIEVTEHINCAKTAFDERKFTLF